jgi:predicted acetyltransferase
MPLRVLGPEDHRAYRLLTASAFGGTPPDPDAPDATPDPGETVLGIDSQDLPGGVPGVLAAGLAIREDTILLGGRRVRCAGISGLAVHPAHRGDGLFRRLVEGIVDHGGASGAGLSMLSNPGIYTRAGWQRIGDVGRVVVPLAELGRLPRVPRRHVSPVTEENWSAVLGLYAEIARGENGLLVREAPLFDRSKPAAPYEAVLVADDEGRPTGYISWTRTQNRDAGAGVGPIGLDVHEMLALDQDSRRALLRVLGSWSTSVHSALVRLLTDDPLLELLPQGTLRPAPRSLDPVLLRVIDAPVALTQRGAPAGIEGSLRLRVIDDYLPERTGTFDLAIGGGEIEVTPVPDVPPGPGTSLDVHALALLIAGGRSIADLRRAGHEVTTDASGAALLDSLFPGPRPSVLDSF